MAGSPGERQLGSGPLSLVGTLRGALEQGVCLLGRVLERRIDRDDFAARRIGRSVGKQLELVGGALGRPRKARGILERVARAAIL